MPSNQTPLGALPARFRRMRLLLVGVGDVGARVAALLPSRVRVMALSSTPHNAQQLRAQGLVVLAGNLDQPATLDRLAGLGARVLHLAPPPPHGDTDTRTRHLVWALQRRAAPECLVYVSTSGVYGDCCDALVTESRTPRPATARARRRCAAEQQWRAWGRRMGSRVGILRVPGIYAPDRPGGTPRERLLQGIPALQAQDDIYSNHIHADDLARACIAALWRARAQRVYHVCDDTVLKMGDYLDLAADLYGLPRPPRLPRAAALAAVALRAPQRQRFMEESRRLSNQRMKQELRLALRYPTVRDGLL